MKIILQSFYNPNIWIFRFKTIWYLLGKILISNRFKTGTGTGIILSYHIIVVEIAKFIPTHVHTGSSVRICRISSTAHREKNGTCNAVLNIRQSSWVCPSDTLSAELSPSAELLSYSGRHACGCDKWNGGSIKILAIYSSYYSIIIGIRGFFSRYFVFENFYRFHLLNWC